MGWAAMRKERRDRLFAQAVYFACRRIETERLVIRWATRPDAAGYLRTIDEEVVEENGWGPTDMEEIRRTTSTASFQVLPMITDRRSGEVIGTISPNRLDAEERLCEMGWWLGPSHRGQGYGTEAVAATVAALHEARVRWVVFGTTTTNEAVVRVMEKLDGCHLGTAPHRLPNGTIVDAAWYGFESGVGASRL